MHDESQVQNTGDRRDVTVTSDSKGRTVYCCKRCHKRFWDLKKADSHIKVCKAKYDFLPEDKEFVVCKICGWHAKRLASHLREVHRIQPEEYDGEVLCESSRLKYEATAKDNGNWIVRANERGDDLTDYKSRMGQAVRESILSSPDDRKRRAQVMSDVNKTDSMRQKASDTAKKTSARKDIQEQRSANLKKWRDENPDEFYEKCTSKMMNPNWQSKPEALLCQILSLIENYQFKPNQVVKSELFTTKSKRKQVDVGDKSKRVYVEFDGPLHFKQTSLNQLEVVQEKDRLLDEHITRHGWTLIRVGYDQFSYRKSDYGFNKECLKKVFDILNNPNSGVYKIGKVYDVIISVDETSFSTLGINV